MQVHNNVEVEAGSVRLSPALLEPELEERLAQKSQALQGRKAELPKVQALAPSPRAPRMQILSVPAAPSRLPACLSTGNSEHAAAAAHRCSENDCSSPIIDWQQAGRC